MEIKDLRKGDVLLFSPEKGSFISWAITFLTNADVSHAAMYYNEETKKIIEETPPQVTTNDASPRFKDREIHVRRLNKADELALTPVIDAATNYLNEKEPYDKSGLYIIGVLLIYKRFTPDTFLQKVIVKILKKVAAVIIDYIHKHETPGKVPMVCSQFVAQCYEDAGDNYHLKIKNGTLDKMADAEDGLTLLEQVMGSAKQTPVLKGYHQIMMNNASFQSDEELAEELKNVLDSNKVDAENEVSEELVEAVHHFAHAYHLAKTGTVDLQNTIPEDVNTVLKTLHGDQTMFVFPGDLLNHCENLKCVGTIE